MPAEDNTTFKELSDNAPGQLASISHPQQSDGKQRSEPGTTSIPISSLMDTEHAETSGGDGVTKPAKGEEEISPPEKDIDMPSFVEWKQKEQQKTKNQEGIVFVFTILNDFFSSKYLVAYEKF